MKVLHLINTLSAGGAELHLLTLCRYLKRLTVDVTVACLREQVKDSRSLRSDFERENIPILNLPADRRYASLFLRSLERLLSAKKPDIVRTHLPRADYTGGVARIFDRDLVGVCSVHVISGKISRRMESVHFRFGLSLRLPALQNHRMIISMT